MSEKFKPIEEASQHESFFDLDKIVHISDLKPMIDNWREDISSNSNYWSDMYSGQMIKNLSESERIGRVDHDFGIRFPEIPWSEVPESLQNVLKTAYDFVSFNQNHEKDISVEVYEKFINFELTPQALREERGNSKEIYRGPHLSGPVRLWLEMSQGYSGFHEPSTLPAGFWVFSKRSNVDEQQEREIQERGYQDIEPTFAERLFLNIPKTKIARATMNELEDLAEFLDIQTPNAKVPYRNQRSVPQIANPPWNEEPTHTLSVSKKGQLQIKAIGESEEETIFEKKEITPDEKKELQSLTTEALKQLINDEESTSLWERFRFTYEKRAKDRWLGEFGYIGEKKPERGEKPQPISDPSKGIVAALKEVLYLFDSNLNEELIERNEKEMMYQEVDEVFKQKLIKAADVIFQDTNRTGNIDDVIWKLNYKGTDIKNITPDDLRRGLENGICKYWEQTYSRGYFNSDPW